MAETTEISWADATFNPWIGCTKVGPGCDHCYAERDNNRRKWVEGWGTGAQRRRTSATNWTKVRRWDFGAPAFFIEHRHWPRVFCASLADVFDNEVDQAWRDDLWALIRATPNLRWMLLTKRIGNAAKMLPPDWPYPNAGLMATVVNQAEADRDVPKLLATPATWRGLSIEPMLGPVDLSQAVRVSGGEVYRSRRIKECLDWVICGGESGPQARPMHPAWVRSLRDQCDAARVAFHFKQWGEYAPCELYPPGTATCSVITSDGRHLTGLDAVWGAPEDDRAEIIARFGKKKSGWLLDGREHKEFPAALTEAA